MRVPSPANQRLREVCTLFVPTGRSIAHLVSATQSPRNAIESRRAENDRHGIGSIPGRWARPFMLSTAKCFGPAASVGSTVTFSPTSRKDRALVEVGDGEGVGRLR